MRYIIAAAAIFAATILAAPAIQAHHGWSSYDASKKITITGPVIKLTYSNPHGAVTMAHEGAEWNIVLAPVSRMQSRGATEEKMTAGKIISVTGYPLKSGEKELRAEFVTLDGVDVQLR